MAENSRIALFGMLREGLAIEGLIAVSFLTQHFQVDCFGRSLFF